MEPTPSSFNQIELLADVREGFSQLEAAISTATPERSRPYVSPELYELVVATVRDLAARGHRRVHGAFEIRNAELLPVEPDPSGSAQPTVRLHATSSLVELDSQKRVVAGSAELMAWTQDVVARRQEATGRWIIAQLGPMSVGEPVTGPSGPPLKPRELTELERRERDSQEHADAFVTATLTFLSLQYPPQPWPVLTPTAQAPFETASIPQRADSRPGPPARRPDIDIAGLVLELGTGLITVLTVVRFILDYARIPCPESYLGGPTRPEWCGVIAVRSWFGNSLIALYTDPGLQVMAAVTGFLLVLVVWRRVF